MAQGNMLEGKVVLVTGAGGGIGRDIALQCAAQGARVVVNDLGASVSGEGGDAGPAQRVVEEIRAAGGEATANTDSVSEVASANRIVQTAMDVFGRIDAVVNNAGILRDRFFHKMSVDEFDTVIKVHLYGGFYVSRAAGGGNIRRGAGAFAAGMDGDGQTALGGGLVDGVEKTLTKKAVGTAGHEHLGNLRVAGPFADFARGGDGIGVVDDD